MWMRTAKSADYSNLLDILYDYILFVYLRLAGAVVRDVIARLPPLRKEKGRAAPPVPRPGKAPRSPCWPFERCGGRRRRFPLPTMAGVPDRGVDTARRLASEGRRVDWTPAPDSKPFADGILVRELSAESGGT